MVWCLGWIARGGKRKRDWRIKGWKKEGEARGGDGCGVMLEVEGKRKEGGEESVVGHSLWYPWWTILDGALYQALWYQITSELFRTGEAGIMKSS
jgi:hypothetical protein